MMWLRKLLPFPSLAYSGTASNANTAPPPTPPPTDPTPPPTEGDPVGVIDGSVFDAVGCVTRIVRGADTWGLATVRYRFQGREHSAATGLTNFRMRWYDAVTGRWLSKDPIGLSGGLNLYAFCGRDPVNHEDFFGNCPNDPASDIPPVVGPQTHHGPHGDYRADPFGHGRKPDGTPKDPHIDQYPKKGGHNRFDQNGDPLRGGKGRVPKADRGPLVRQLKILESSCLKCRQLWWCQVGSLWD